MARGRKTALTIHLTADERQTLMAWQRSTTIPAGYAKRGRIILSVSHLLHMAFFTGLYDSRGQLCFVNPTMQSRICLQLAVLPHWGESRSCTWQVCKVACLSSYRAAILSVTYPMASLRW